ncbi:hypothetical protein FE784_09170 [Paenibacillus hemerocallicola]|uniref:Uncharacterized protein n=1 Tax=Paenibacillus hemerocallicola TaxID=1172614 RepID=A0A5C4TDM5_9BACL|nr:hypothetical protein [Paenibacillus hemerocallicola]TNJ66726.1 hypothetical protein FE784_09170 [Paenibacillus hemerocallicola]
MGIDPQYRPLADDFFAESRDNLARCRALFYRQNVYDTGPLPEGLHTIRVETIWERNPSATTYYVSFDELQVTLPAP